MKVRVMNNSKARQGVHTTSGVVYINPGSHRDVTLTEPGMKFADRLDFLELSSLPEGKEPEGKEPEGNGLAGQGEGSGDPELDAVRKQADGLGLKWHPKAKAATIRKLIEKKLEE
jgi:hypothetical protein